MLIYFLCLFAINYANSFGIKKFFNIRSKSQEISSKSGTGLGTFLGKTLLERKGASLKFSKSEKLGGAKVSINFPVNNLR